MVAYRLSSIRIGLLLATLVTAGTGCRREGPSPELPAPTNLTSNTSVPSAATNPASPSSANLPAPGVIEAINRGVALMGHYQYEEAVKAFEEALQAAPRLIPVRINLAIALFNRAQKQTGDIERAQEILDAVLAEDPSNLQALYFKAIVLQHTGHTAEAIPLLQQVIQQRPADGAAWYLLGLCKQRLGQPAEKEFLQAVHYRPYLYSAWYKLFQVAVANGEADKAKTYMQKFKEVRASPLGESIELPQYNQMGDLALVRPWPATRRPPLTPGLYQLEAPQLLDAPPLPAADRTALAAVDLNGDHRPDLLAAAESEIRFLLSEGGEQLQSTQPAGPLPRPGAIHALAIGDLQNDERPDLALVGTDGLELWSSSEDGWTNLPIQPVFTDLPRPLLAALWLDADHDADLDLLLAGAGGLRLYRNNTDGSFTNATDTAGLACNGDTVTGVLAADLDGDRDADLAVLRRGGPVRLFRNELLNRFVEIEAPQEARGDLAGALQDFNGDGRPDLLALGGDPTRLTLWIGNGHGGFEPGPDLTALSHTALEGDPPRTLRVADADLDGDLDILLAGEGLRLLLNDGEGRFAQMPEPWPGTEQGCRGLLWADWDGDQVPDLLLADREGRLWRRRGRLEPPGTGLAIGLTGVRSRDGRTRSPATGFGARLTLRCGLTEQTRWYTGLAGGPDQSWLPMGFGLGGGARADYLQILWPDGVAQVEIGLAAGQTHRFAELQRKISSCPVLFSWDGRRFVFVTDFAGVGGLGYFSPAGEHAAPQAEEHIKIQPGQLAPKDGVYELRITEPMEEVAYVDRLELMAVDHPIGWDVFPDERFATGGPPPTHRLLVVTNRIDPVQAWDPEGRDCLDRLREADRLYAYEPELDRRFIGFCRPHTLEIDFGDRLQTIPPDQRMFLFINGFIEYPYSSTVYAAAQAGVQWQSIRIDAAGTDGRWHTIIPDAGIPGGMARTFTVELTGLLNGVQRLRLTTNLEIYYDQLFVAPDAGTASVQLHRLPPKAAELHHRGFALEFSPDGRLPWIYDYDLTEPTAPFHVQHGPYTRYGPVTELLFDFDDRYVILGPGDEIAVRFDASALPPLPEGQHRSFILVSHAYCKDMDLYTATPSTVEPLPFRGMTTYPYPATERFPDTPEHRAWRESYNTRWIP